MTRFGFVKVAALSPRVSVAGPEKNIKRALESIVRAKDEQAQIMVLPELYISGYTCGDLFNQDTLICDCEKALEWLISKTKTVKALIAIGLPVRVRDKLFNCAAVIQSGKLLGVVPKSFIPNYSEYYEKRWFESGIGCGVESISLCGSEVPFGSLIFQMAKDVRVGIEICEDLWVPVPPSSLMALNGANIILNLSASSEMVTKNDYRHELILQQSAKCICGYVYACAGVGESTTDLVFSGACSIAENGVSVTEGKRFCQEGSSIYGCIDVKMLSAIRRSSSFFDNVHGFNLNTQFRYINADLPHLLVSAINREFNPHPFVPSDERQRSKRCREIIAIQATGLAKRMTYVGSKKAILGLSGGLDSTLALLVTTEAMNLQGLPMKNILCVTMPGFGTTKNTKNNATELAKCIGTQLIEINIEAACIQHMKDIGHDIKVHDTTYENVQARERTQILMDLANKEGALLVGTGDLSELALGWCTYNGDHMSMYAVNSGVPKTLVQHLVSFVADSSDSKTSRILQSILKTPISPELLPPGENGEIGQKTEEYLGPYEVHDFFLYYFMRYGSSPDKIILMAERAFQGKYTKEQLKNWLAIFMKRFFSQQFKRSCLPDGPKVGSVSLSPRGDWRMPSDAECNEWIIEWGLKTKADDF